MLHEAKLPCPLFGHVDSCLNLSIIALSYHGKSRETVNLDYLKEWNKNMIKLLEYETKIRWKAGDSSEENKCNLITTNLSTAETFILLLLHLWSEHSYCSSGSLLLNSGHRGALWNIIPNTNILEIILNKFVVQWYRCERVFYAWDVTAAVVECVMNSRHIRCRNPQSHTV